MSYITDEEGERKPVKREMRFIDSFRFMPTSLDALIKNLDPETVQKFKEILLRPKEV